MKAANTSTYTPNYTPSDSDRSSARAAVLFSGGLDCALLARLTNDLLPVGESIDLLNVTFYTHALSALIHPKLHAHTDRARTESQIAQASLNFDKFVRDINSDLLKSIFLIQKPWSIIPPQSDSRNHRIRKWNFLSLWRCTLQLEIGDLLKGHVRLRYRPNSRRNSIEPMLVFLFPALVLMNYSPVTLNIALRSCIMATAASSTTSNLIFKELASAPNRPAGALGWLA